MGIKFNTDGKSNYNLLHKNFNKNVNIDYLDVEDKMELYFAQYNAKPQFTSQKSVLRENYNIKVALWQVPYEMPFSKILKRYDSDKNSWLEYRNVSNENEIEEAERSVGSYLNQYKVLSKNTYYEDGTKDVISKYPNGTKIIEHHGDNSVFINIMDEKDRIVAEKVYSYDSSAGRKIVYQNIEKDDNIFSVARVYSYDTTNNRNTDVVNFGYTGKSSTLTKGCKLEKEYYLLNGEEVEAKCKNGSEYKVKDKSGKKYKFIAE